MHDCALLQYGDKLEASGKFRPEILNLSIADLSSQFGMKRGHIARFMDRNSACADPLPAGRLQPTISVQREWRPQHLEKIAF